VLEKLLAHESKVAEVYSLIAIDYSSLKKHDERRDVSGNNRVEVLEVVVIGSEGSCSRQCIVWCKAPDERQWAARFDGL
jgi:hypothetical protein